MSQLTESNQMLTSIAGPPESARTHEQISLIVAAFNEEDNISQCIAELLAYAPNGEVVVVHGGFDRTADIADETRKEYGDHVTVVRNKNDRGKGHAIREGIARARFPLMAQFDADLQFQARELPKLIQPILDGRVPVTFGSRFIGGADSRVGAEHRSRNISNYAVSLYTSVLCGHRYTDVMAGFKAWTRAAIERIDLRCNHFGYEAEIAIRAAMVGIPIEEVPITYDPRRKGQSNVNLLRDGFLVGTYLLRTRLSWR
ncbi:MAG: glycosyltransferase family 2 protein [Chloroflexi bacterium]|nr:glycosyltransferase family 2 protein [Chloroflexota bacterium]